MNFKTMSDKFQNKYRIPSARLKNWDYRTNAMYFVTICTKNREHYFGEIEQGEMILSDIGKLCEEFLNKIPEHFPFVLIDESVVMPNHVHAIVVIDNPVSVATVETLHATSLQSNAQQSNAQQSNAQQSNTQQSNAPTDITKNTAMASISPKSGSLSTILRSFKSAVTKDAHFIHADFEWQTRFHDHIIRNDESYHTIKNYIKVNPQSWKKDKFYNLQK